MQCKSFGVTQVMVGLHRVGIVGLGTALEKADQAGLTDREELLDFLIGLVAEENYVPDRGDEGFRRALWREYLRHKEEDFSDFLSEVDVVVRGEPGEERDRFVATAESIFARFELKPLVTFEPKTEEGRNPQLAIGDHTIVRGNPSQRQFESAVRKSFSDW